MTKKVLKAFSHRRDPIIVLRFCSADNIAVRLTVRWKETMDTMVNKNTVGKTEGGNSPPHLI